jgi:hypothetical protein
VAPAFPAPPGALLAAAAARDGARPLVTWYDDATGDRIELSVATAANWAVKTANLLAEADVDEVWPEPADHWLAVVVLLGAWTAGVCVGDRGDRLPASSADFIAEVLPQPDALLLPPPDPATPGLRIGGHVSTLAGLGAVAAKVTARHALAGRCRVLSLLALDTSEGIELGLLGPLAAGGSTILVANADPERWAGRASDERATHVVGMDLAGLPRLG